MIPTRRLPSSLLLLPVLASDHVAQFPHQLRVFVPNDEDSLRMGDEGCPNESPSVDDATGYSKEEEEEEEENSLDCEEVL